MKNFVKKGLITVGTIFALLGVGGTVAFASGYITWDGSDNFEQAMENLGLIKNEMKADKEENQKLVTEKENLIVQVNNLTSEKSQLEKQLQDAKNENSFFLESVKTEANNLYSKVTATNGKGNRYDVFVEELNRYSGQIGLGLDFGTGLGQGMTKSQLEQAEIDMKAILEETEKMLNTTVE